MLVYKVTNIINGKSYVGQTTKSLNHRRKKHQWSNDGYAFHNAIRKYGRSKFEWEVLEECDSKEEMDEMEFHYIKQFDSKVPNGYNLTDGGEGVIGYTHSKETRKKMSLSAFNRPTRIFSEDHKRRISESRLGNKNPNYNKPMPKHVKKMLATINKNKTVSKETRKKISDARLKMPPMTYETRKKISESHKGKELSDEHKLKLSEALTGHVVSSETKKKISNTNKGSYAGNGFKRGTDHLYFGKCGTEAPATKKYVIVSPEGNEFIVSGLKKFCRNYKTKKLNFSNMSACASGKRRHHKGYKCRYYNEELDSNLEFWGKN